MTRPSPTRRTRVYRTLTARAVTLFAVALSLLTVPAVQAQGRKASLSDDLAKQRDRKSVV